MRPKSIAPVVPLVVSSVDSPVELVSLELVPPEVVPPEVVSPVLPPVDVVPLLSRSLPVVLLVPLPTSPVVSTEVEAPELVAAPVVTTPPVVTSIGPPLVSEPVPPAPVVAPSPELPPEVDEQAASEPARSTGSILKSIEERRYTQVSARAAATRRSTELKFPPSLSSSTASPTTRRQDPTMTHRLDIFTAALQAVPLTLALGVSGCDPESPELAVEDEPVQARTTVPPVWDPHPINPALCHNEVLPSRPPTGGQCEIEVRLKQTMLLSGQGFTEGRAELSVAATGGLVGGPPSAAASYPASGADKYNVGETKGMDLSLGTYTVPSGTHEVVEVCLTFTEHDNGGVHGHDDVATVCENVTLSCHATKGQPTYQDYLGPGVLCGPNNCNGQVGAQIEVIRADADGDDIPNPDDFTPDLCDEQLKGTEGVALLMYYHYEDEGFINLAQALGTNLSQNYAAYDRVVLVMDNASSNPLNVNDEAFKRADVVFSPTRDGLRDAIQDLTSRGYRFDVLLHAHGSDVGTDDARVEVLSGSSITGDWLVDTTEPNVAGTARGGVPIVSFWTTACYAGHMADAWDTVGALASSGAQDVNFFPAAYSNYWDAWINGTDYQQAVDDSITVGVAGAAANFIDIEGDLWGCSGVNDSVLLKNSCAEDFFTDLGVGDTAAYDIKRIYDYARTGAQNMVTASTRMFTGNTAVTFGGAGASWP